MGYGILKVNLTVNSYGHNEDLCTIGSNSENLLKMVAYSKVLVEQVLVLFLRIQKR
jgi:hypothetical protein